MIPRAIVAFLLTIALSVVAAPANADPISPVAASGADARTGLPDGWTPGPEKYTIGEQKNHEIVTSDGVVLRADVRYPTNPDGSPAAGPFPIVLTQTAYGKDSTGLMRILSYDWLGPELDRILPSGVEVLRQVADAAGYGDYFVRRGYIQVIVDLRGTGSSGGQWSILNPQEREDSKRVLEWAARLPNSTGEIGLYGLSYLGMSGLMAAGVLDKGGPVKALFPLMPGNNLFQDILNHDGFYNIAFLAAYLWFPNTLLPELDPILGLYQQPEKMLQVMYDHLLSNIHPDGSWLSVFDALSDGEKTYSGPYWDDRAIDSVLEKLADNDIPTYLIGGQYDVLQDGTPRTFSGLQNAWAGRPHGGPMPAGAPSTGRFQMLFGPWFHVQPGIQRTTTDIDIHAIQLAWFDRWLKGDRNGIDETDTPLHAIDLNGNVIESATYPVADAPARNYYLRAGGRLSVDKPADTVGSDRIDFSAINSGTICNKSFSQNFAGAYQLLARMFAVDDPCTGFVPQGDLPPVIDNPQYTSEPFTERTVLAGPIGATLFATSNKPASAFTVTVQDIAPDGTATALTDGQLAGNYRALDESKSWRAADGSLLAPYHPGTRESMLPVVPGEIIEYNVKVRPAFHVFEPGHRLQVTVASGDAPTHILLPKDYPNLFGGAYDVQRNAQFSSYLTIPLG